MGRIVKEPVAFFYSYVTIFTPGKCDTGVSYSDKFFFSIIPIDTRKYYIHVKKNKKMYNIHYFWRRNE